MLEQLGYRADSVNNGVEALQALDRGADENTEVLGW
jgi:CheY-like chemotaxis protein